MATKPPDGVLCPFTIKEFRCLHPDAWSEYFFDPVLDRARGVYVVPEGVEVRAAVRNLTWDNGMPHCKECGICFAHHRSSLQLKRRCELCEKSSRDTRQALRANRPPCAICIKCLMEVFRQVTLLRNSTNPPFPLCDEALLKEAQREDHRGNVLAREPAIPL
jgi:hypothetical protein